MKKRSISLLFGAAIIALGLLSCAHEGEEIVSLDETRSVLLKVVAGAPITYADEVSQSAKSTAIDVTKRADLYFLDSSNSITDHFVIKADALAEVGDIKVSDLTVVTGRIFPEVSGNATQVYLIVNEPPTGLPLPTAGSLSAIEAVAMNITSFSAINTVTMKGKGSITPGRSASAAVAVAPVVARFEIAKVEYDTTAPSSRANVITQFDLAGIFVNNYHKKMGLNFIPISGECYTSMAPSDYTATNYPAPVADLFADKTNAISYTPANRWAYQFFSTDAANGANDHPMLVVKLNRVTDPENRFTGDQFVSVNKFESLANPGTYITRFDPNHIYIINTIKFSNRNLSPLPGVVLQDVSVTVTVTPWLDVNIIPQL